MLPIKELEAIPEERMSERIVEQSVDVPVPLMRREIAEMVQLVQVERIKGRVADQMVDILVPPVMEEILAVVQKERRSWSQRNECNSGLSIL